MSDNSYQSFFVFSNPTDPILAYQPNYTYSTYPTYPTNSTNPTYLTNGQNQHSVDRLAKFESLIHKYEIKPEYAVKLR